MTHEFLTDSLTDPYHGMSKLVSVVNISVVNKSLQKTVPTPGATQFESFGEGIVFAQHRAAGLSGSRWPHMARISVYVLMTSSE